VYQSFFKPILDFIVSLSLFLVLSPIFLLLSLFLAISLKGNPFFFQKRPGKQERLFTIIKFKTMNDTTENKGKLLSDEKRMTKFGKLIRTTSLDELPQLLNVLKGDMSFVGPRPLLPEYLSLYSETQKKRHEVKPGITGYAQVNGRNAISWEQKFEYDLIYIKKQSFLLDLKILLKTVKKVFLRSGINKQGATTMSRFKGTNRK